MPSGHAGLAEHLGNESLAEGVGADVRRQLDRIPLHLVQPSANRISCRHYPEIRGVALWQNTLIRIRRRDRQGIPMIRSQEIVLGVDSSTQSTKVVAVDLDTGAVVSEGRATHTGADTQDPTDWWSALETAVRIAVTDDMTVRGIAVAGQQHGFVTLDLEGSPVRPAPLWNNVSSAPDAERLNEQADFAAAVGSRLVASFTITKLALSGTHLAGGACPCPRDLPAARLPELSLDRDTDDRPQ